MTAKDPEAFRTISEVSQALAIPQHILRFWETRFPQLKPLKRGGNRRYYRPSDVAFAAVLHRLLHTDGYTVKGVQKLIADHGVSGLMAMHNQLATPPAETGANAPVSAPHILPRLVAIRRRLALAIDQSTEAASHG